MKVVGVMDLLDNSLFESIYQEAKKYRSKAQLLDNDFNEQWECIGHKTKVFKDFEKIVSKASTSRSKLSLGEVAKVKGTDHYVAMVYGGLNGKGDWNNYFKDLTKFIGSFDYDIWLIDIKNDCADDVFTARLGFRPE